MGTQVQLTLVGSAEEALRRGRAVALRFEEVESRCSRFRSESELSRLNREGRAQGLSEELFALLERCQRYSLETEGLFDPAVGASLCALGYDAPFAPGALDRESASPHEPPRGSMREVRLDRSARAATLPEGVELDLGGIAKGYAAQSCESLLGENAVLDAGGDLLLRGAGPEGEGWPVELEDPREPEAAWGLLVLRDRAVATSAPNRRRWRAGERWRHHLVDPRTGGCVEGELAQVTVVCEGLERAEALSKAAFVLGWDEGPRWLSRQVGVGAVLLHREGAGKLVGGLRVEGR